MLALVKTEKGVADAQTQQQAPEWLYRATLLLIVLAPTQLALALDPKTGPFIAYGDILAAAVVGLWMIWRLRKGSAGLIWPPMAVAGLLLTALLSAGMAESLKAVAVETVQITLYFVAVYMLFADILTTRQRIRGALIALAIPTAVNVVIGVYQYFAADEAFDVGALLSNRNVYSAYLAMVLPIGFGIMLWLAAGWLRWLLCLGIAAGVLTMLSPPLVWVALVVALVLIMSAQRQARNYGLALVVSVAALVILLPKNHDAAVRELLDPREEGPLYKLANEVGDSEQEPYIVKKRWLEWGPALNMMAENFILGVGAGNFQLNIGRSEYYGFLPNVKKSEPDTNNLYLVVGCTMGFAGLICLVAYLGHFWRKASVLWLQVEDGWPRGLAMGLAGSVAAIALANIFTSLFVRGTGVIWALVFAMIAVMSQGAMRNE